MGSETASDPARLTDAQRANILRRVRLSPYRKGMGPTFGVTLWDTGRTDWRGQVKIGYRLTQREGGRSVVLFSGEDFSPSPGYASDGDKTVAALLGFLTLRPGDTDAEYFAAYTPAQLAFCDAHAETLACEAITRFGGD